MNNECEMRAEHMCRQKDWQSAGGGGPQGSSVEVN